MKATFRVLLLCVTLCYYVAEAADECGCPVYHPQQAICNSDFAIVGKIEYGEESSLPFQPTPKNKPYSSNSGSHYVYNVSVLQVFMPAALSDMEGEKILLWTPNTWCGLLTLQYMEEYVISGTFVDVENPDAEGEYVRLLMATRCEFTKLLDDITDHQKKGLMSDYINNCDRCQIAGIQSSLRHATEDVTTLQLIPGAVSTAFWTLDVGCFFNPVSAKHNLVHDCESEDTFCRYDHARGSCMWDMNDDFLKCFKERGITVAYRDNKAAVTRASDCKYLQSKRLKKKCLRDVFKYKQQLRQQRRGQ